MFVKALPPSVGNEGLRSVIWPGGFVTVPRGWVIPTKLKIAVPRKAGWKEFASVSFDQESNKTRVTGFSIDVFQAVVRKLDHDLLCDFFPYPEQHNYSDDYSYDDLIEQVQLKKYDAIAGDVTITAKRSKIVDFTQPYTETGLVMVAPTAVLEEANSAWTFLHPFTPALWATTAGFLVYTGLVVWLLEHKINPAFRGSPATQVVTLLWFAFSAVFYAHQERVRNSLTQLVVVVWLFVVFVLTSSYTANFASRLTAQQITPHINSGDYKVGYRSSYVGTILNHDSGLAKINTKPFSSRKAYEEALTKGAKNGGVDAILVEIPFVRAFLSGQCGYSMVGTTYQSGGYGFVFPKGSLLVQDFSEGILNLSESDELRKIRAKYFNDTINECFNSSGNLKRLDVLKISRWKSIKSFAQYLYREDLSSQLYELEMSAEKSNPPKMKKTSGEHLELDFSVGGNTDHNVVIPTSSSVNLETRNEAPSNQIHQ
ncbi:hypothetical protein SUGI_0576850 [Cryptomeria japonica]|nr:hypothetical protein SUGI_0576850 [Cryptomeria japonica]